MLYDQIFQYQKLVDISVEGNWFTKLVINDNQSQDVEYILNGLKKWMISSGVWYSVDVDKKAIDNKP